MPVHLLSFAMKMKSSLISCALLCLIFCSCSSSYRKITYFKDVPDSSAAARANRKLPVFREPAIQVDDILQVSIQTIDPQVNTALNPANSPTYSVQPTSSAVPYASALAVGYLVDKEGNIEMSVAGKVKVLGLTTAQARDAIREKVSRYYKEPVVNVRFSNFKITVLGEVNRPASYTVPNEKVSLLDALGMAGDLTIYGKRSNVLLIREEDGEKKFFRFDLNRTDMFTSPYFYLRQGDVVYIEPLKSKAAAADVGKNRQFTLIASTIAALVSIIAIATR